MTHVMLDLETWGKRPGCDIRSIGAVVFDPVMGTVGNSLRPPYHIGRETKFYIATNNPVIASEIVNGYQNKRLTYPLTRDPETVAWWNKHGKCKACKGDGKLPDYDCSDTGGYFVECYECNGSGKSKAESAFTNPVDLREALIRFAEWLQSLTGRKHTFDSETQPDDIRLWSNGPQFDVSILDAVYHAVGLPVSWHYRAPRDFRTITDAAGMTRDDFCNYGDAHNALDDAIAQAMTVCEAYKRLGLQR